MRDFLNIINEKLYYSGPLKTYYGEVETTVYLNPTKSEIMKLKRVATGGQLRALMDYDTIWVWPAHDMAHSEMARALKIDGADLHLEDHYITVNDFDPDASDEQAEDFARDIKNHPSIIALYGPDVNIEIEASEGRKEWSF